MRTKKRGTVLSVPKKESTNYSKLDNLCLLLVYGSMAIMFYADYKHMESLFYFSLGMVFTSLCFFLERRGK